MSISQAAYTIWQHDRWYPFICALEMKKAIRILLTNRFWIYQVNNVFGDYHLNRINYNCVELFYSSTDDHMYLLLFRCIDHTKCEVQLFHSSSGMSWWEKWVEFLVTIPPNEGFCKLYSSLDCSNIRMLDILPMLVCQIRFESLQEGTANYSKTECKHFNAMVKKTTKGDVYLSKERSCRKVCRYGIFALIPH